MAACCCKSTKRHPHNFPTFENDFSFSSRHGGMQPKRAFDFPLDKAQRQQPWFRLSANSTLTSMRHEALYFDPKAPRDDLDLLLKSVYDNHEALFATKPDVCLQAETTGVDIGRVFTKHVVPVPKPPLPLNHPLRIVTQEKRETLNSIKKAIGSDHCESSRYGYSRKPNGGRYFN